MADIRKLIAQLASQEKLLNDTEFLAPCLPGCKVKTRVEQIIHTLTPQPADFEGWGIFQPINNQEAALSDEPSLPQLSHYLSLFPALRLYLAYHLQGQTWLAYPMNESDMKQRFRDVKPIPVHLVTEGTAFTVIIARYDGAAWWFEECDRKSDPQITTQLSDHLRQQTAPDAIAFSGMTPEMRTVYDLAWQQTPAGRQRQQTRERVRNRKEKPKDRRQQEIANNPENRLERALQQGGGQLESFCDRTDFWLVEWRTQNGELHTSAIDKSDLTVISSGICLSGKDRDFDLQSLVGVIEGRGWD